MRSRRQNRSSKIDEATAMRSYETCCLSMMRTNVPDALMATGCSHMDLSASCCAPTSVPSVRHRVRDGRRGSSLNLVGQAKAHRKVLSQKVLCRSLSSIHILYNQDPVQAPYSLLGRCSRLERFNWPEVVLFLSDFRPTNPRRDNIFSTRGLRAGSLPWASRWIEPGSLLLWLTSGLSDLLRGGSPHGHACFRLLACLPGRRVGVDVELSR